MKVNIGPYRNWIGPYQIANLICFWCKSNGDTDTLADKLGKYLSEVKWLNDFCNWLDSKKKRRIKIKIHKYDTWNMDNTLALIVVPMLKQLKKTKHGAPCVDDVDVPVELKSTSAPPKENEWDTDEHWFKRWDYVMDEMIYAFEHYLDEDSILQMFTVNRKLYDETQARIDNGFRLFGKYYRSLWD